jgi:radial spoke head protein 9
LYSKDCVHWGLLTPPTNETLQKAKLMLGRFTGDPAYECEHREITKVTANDTETEMEIVTTMKEEDRLAAVIVNIDQDVRIVPRGAFAKSPTGQVYRNRSFEGLSVAEAAKLFNYLHMRKPQSLFEKTLLQRANLDKSIDFMDSIEDDLPKGSWSVQFERGSGLVTLRSLLWLGYTFYNVPNTSYYGSVYVGTGERNIDLPFML